MSDKLATINELQPIAKRLREREEQIGSKINNVRAHMGDALVLFAEQGRDTVFPFAWWLYSVFLITE